MSRLSRREFIVAAGSGIAVCALAPVFGEETKVRPVSSEMVRIPAGRFIMGTSAEEAERLAREYGYHPSWLGGETPAREVDLPAFEIDKYPVTNREFRTFCAATGYAPRPHWGGPEPPEAIRDHPVTFVSVVDAQAYADWAGKRLPTEAQWEKAARGTDGRLFPWGSKFDPEACQWNRVHTPEGPGTASVRAHPGGASPYGVMDMVGNVAEWCADSPGPGSAFIKGGCWLTGEIINLRVACRNMSGFATNASMLYGFRCAKGAG